MTRFNAPFGGKTANDRTNLDQAGMLARLLNTHRVASSATIAPTAVRNEYLESGHSFTVGKGVRFNGTNWVLADGTGAQSSHADGIVSAVAGDWFELTSAGLVRGLSGLTAGTVYYLDASGALTTTATAQKIGRAITTTELLVDACFTPSTSRGSELANNTYTSGSGSTSINASTAWVYVRVVGGGGGGAGGSTDSVSPQRERGGGGGASGEVLHLFFDGKPSSLSYVVGGGGAGGGSGSNGTNGTSSSVTINGSVTLEALGGNGGVSSATGTNSGMGGVGGTTGGGTRPFGWGSVGSLNFLAIPIPNAAGMPSRLKTLTQSITGTYPVSFTSEGGRGGANGTSRGSGGDGADSGTSGSSGGGGSVDVVQFG